MGRELGDQRQLGHGGRCTELVPEPVPDAVRQLQERARRRHTALPCGRIQRSFAALLAQGRQIHVMRCRRCLLQQP